MFLCKQDHVLFGPDYVVNVKTHSLLALPEYAAQAIEEFNLNGTGPLSNVGADMLGKQAVPKTHFQANNPGLPAFERLPQGALSEHTWSDLDAMYPQDWPNVEYLILDAYAGNAHDLLLGSPPNITSYASCFAALVAPFSRGNVTIASNSTLDNPVISPNWLLDPRDQETAVAAFKRARAIFGSDAMKPVIVGDEVYPGTNVTTDEQILDVIMNGAMTVYHAAGTNAMGRPNDPLAVVDPKARVYGVQGVRVVDASAFPILPPGHPQATVCKFSDPWHWPVPGSVVNKLICRSLADMLAEKIADDILNGR